MASCKEINMNATDICQRNRLEKLAQILKPLDPETKRQMFISQMSKCHIPKYASWHGKIWTEG